MKKFIEELLTIYTDIKPNSLIRFDIHRNKKELIPLINISESIFWSWMNIINNDIISEVQFKESDIIRKK